MSGSWNQWLQCHFGTEQTESCPVVQSRRMMASRSRRRDASDSSARRVTSRFDLILSLDAGGGEGY